MEPRFIQLAITAIVLSPIEAALKNLQPVTKMAPLQQHDMILILVCELSFTYSTCAMFDLYLDLNCLFVSENSCFQGDFLSSGRHWIGPLGRLLPNSQIEPN